jgi:hypothetical protein
MTRFRPAVEALGARLSPSGLTLAPPVAVHLPPPRPEPNPGPYPGDDPPIDHPELPPSGPVGPG